MTVFAIPIFGQQTITLQECYDLVEKNYPNAKQTNLLKQKAVYEMDALQKAKLPTISLNAKATYQSNAKATYQSNAKATYQSNAKATYQSNAKATYQSNAKATYQSNVISLPIAMPGIEPLNKGQYKATLDVNQLILTLDQSINTNL